MGRRDPIQPGQLFHVAIAMLDAGEVRLPNHRGIAGLLELLGQKRQWAVPGPGIDAHDLDALIQQVQCGLPGHAGPFDQVLGLPPKGIRTRTHQDDIQGFEPVADPVQLFLDIIGGDARAIRFVAEIKHHAVLETPLQGHLVDGQRRCALVHGWVVVKRRIQVGAGVGGQMHHLQRPPQGLGQLLLFQTRKERLHLLRALGVVDVVDFGDHHLRIAGQIRFDGYGQIDDFSSHTTLLMHPLGGR